MPTPNYALLVEQISTSLTAASMQNRVSASNIANRDSEAYVRLKVAFDQALGAAGEGPATAGLAGLQPPAGPRVVPDVSNPKVSLEEELLELSKNTMNYQAMAKALSRYFSIAEAIASGGRS
ncbi:hypothetical protein OOT46_23945 [Aquabacterium sp. A7-Y]|uniref:hypothetical protein n=1 Tax=Aquabacterium sp. A7-Y TaxID=1349605 RepID=UPI00223D9D86|nr:hypothetical protein [Aquabacterium sp. A7-Y]MCW7540878.1 hypothetical protein [Aquabacterium sp. A7-Y]